MGELRLLPGERVEAELRPHVLSWLGKYFVGAFSAIWGLFLLWLFHTDWWTSGATGKWFEFWTFLYGNTYAGYVYAIAGLALVGAALSVAMIRWRIFFAYLVIGALSVGLAVWASQNATSDAVKDNAVVAFLILFAIPGGLWMEIQRRTHKYHLTNLRIVFAGGLATRHERQVRYESITDLDGQQGLLGRMLDYGTIIPVTQSGFGLGEDTSEAHIGVGAGASKGGMMGGVGVAAGGGKGVNTARARTFHQLTGVRPYGDTKYTLERLIQEATTTPYLREQVDLQRRMVDALERVGGAGPVDASDVPRGPQG